MTARVLAGMLGAIGLVVAGHHVPEAAPSLRRQPRHSVNPHGKGRGKRAEFRRRVKEFAKDRTVGLWAPGSQAKHRQRRQRNGAAA